MATVNASLASLSLGLAWLTLDLGAYCATPPDSYMGTSVCSVRSTCADFGVCEPLALPAPEAEEEGSDPEEEGSWTSWFFGTGRQPAPSPPQPAPAPSPVRGWGAWVLRGYLTFLDVAGETILGRERWTRLKRNTILVILFLNVLLVLYGLDLALRPVLWMVRLLRRLYLWARPPPGGVPVRVRSRDLDWRGPAAEDEVDNDFYRDNIRARGANRQPRHLVISLNGRLARLDRGGRKIHTAKRHG